MLQCNIHKLAAQTKRLSEKRDPRRRKQYRKARYRKAAKRFYDWLDDETNKLDDELNQTLIELNKMYEGKFELWKTIFQESCLG